VSRKYLIETYGCQMNYHDSEQMAGLLEAAGYERTQDDHDADVVVINTCSVREHAEEKLYTRLGELRVLHDETGRDPIVAVAGCVAQQEGAALARRSSMVDVVVGTRRTRILPMLVDQAIATRRAQFDLGAHDNVAFPFGLTRRDDPVRAWVTIIEGCNEYCSFCVVPYTRGHERMRPKAEILAEVRDAAARGLKEVQLLGQIVNHYQAPDDPGCDFAGLLEAVHELDGIERIRFASPHPRHVTERLLAAIAGLPKVCKHLHLPVQSGSSRVLTVMRRRYNRESYLDLIDRVRAAVPDIAITTDVIVGFPGETNADFDDTLSLTARVRYHSMFSFKYSERPNTLASKRHADDVPDDEKTRRIVALQQMQRDIQLELHAGMVGQRFDVLLDATSRRRPWELSGRTSGNTVVNLPGEAAWIGRTVPVTIRRAGPNSVWGEIGSDGSTGSTGSSIGSVGSVGSDGSTGPALREIRPEPAQAESNRRGA
jgi:tRNA-2-methylthio-N6-dimethylallyladenosine synthase